MNVLLIADGDIKYGASHSLFQMAKELSSFYEINIQIVMPVTAGFKGNWIRESRFFIFVIPHFIREFLQIDGNFQSNILCGG